MPMKLAFVALPEKILAFRFEKCSGRELSKERLTISFCTNMTGQKENMLLIRKAQDIQNFINERFTNTVEI